MKKFIALSAAALLAVSLYAGEFADITLAKLKSDIAAGKVTLLDANGTESFQKGHIPGAIDFEANEKNLKAVLPKDKSALVVAYCGNPRCSAYRSAAVAAEKLGYKNIKHFSAGIAGWKSAGEKTEAAK